MITQINQIKDESIDYFLFSLTVVLIVVVAMRLRVQRLEHEALWNYTSLLVFGCLDLFLLGLHLIKLLFFHDFSEKSRCYLRLGLYRRSGLICNRIFLVNYWLLAPVESWIDFRIVYELLIVIGQNFINDWLVYSFIIDQRILYLRQHFKTLAF